MEDFIIEIEKQLNTGNAQQERYRVSENGSTIIYGCPDEECALIFIKVDERWVFQQKLTANDGASGDFFGVSASLSADGSTAIVGAYYKSSATGAAYVYTRSGSTWKQQQKLTARDGAAHDYFGISVSISSDGNTALIGAYGAAYVFTLVWSTWVQQAKLAASDASTYSWFGHNIILSSDGNTVLIGAHLKEYAFKRVDNKWTETTIRQMNKSPMPSQKDNNQHVLTSLQSVFVNRVPYDLWVLLNNIIHYHTGLGGKISVLGMNHKTYINKTLADELISNVTKLQTELNLPQDMVREMIDVINSRVGNKNIPHPSQGFFTGQHQQQPMTPPFNTPFSLPPGMYMPPHHMYPGIHQQHPGGMTPPWQQQNGWMQPPTENLSMRKQLELQMLNNELAPLQYQLGQLQECVKYLQAKIKAIEAIPEE